MARTEKAAALQELAEKFRGADAAVLTEYRGLSVAQLQTLRRSLGAHTSYSIVKNTLTKLAAKEAGIEGLDEHLSGPSAIAFVSGDPVEAAKGLREFAKDNPQLIIKAGFMDGQIMSATEIDKLADLESREVLLAKLAGAMKGSMSKAASLFNAPLSQAARTVEALRVKAEADPSILAGGAGTPATVTAAEAPAAAEGEAAEAPAAADSAELSADASSQENTEG